MTPTSPQRTTPASSGIASGTASGTVMSVDGVAIGNATVTSRSAGGQNFSTVRTDSLGRYSNLSLPASSAPIATIVGFQTGYDYRVMTARVGETNTVDLVLEPMPDLPVGTSRTDSVRSIDLPVHFVGDSTTFTCDACRVYALPIGSANRRVTVQWDPTVGQLLGAWVLGPYGFDVSVGNTSTTGTLALDLQGFVYNVYVGIPGGSAPLRTPVSFTISLTER